MKLPVELTHAAPRACAGCGTPLTRGRVWSLCPDCLGSVSGATASYVDALTCSADEYRGRFHREWERVTQRGA